MEFTLLFAAIAGVGPLWFLAGRQGEGLADLALGATITGLLVGRLVAMVEVGINPLTSPGDILIIRGGVSTIGATLAALAYLGWSARDRPAQAIGGLAAPALAGLAGWHAGCVFRGTCLGTVSFWGRHPVEIYAAVLLGLGAFLLYLLRHRVQGLAAGAASLASAGASRLATEPFRPSLTGGPRLAYALAILVGGLGLLFYLRRSSPPGR